MKGHNNEEKIIHLVITTLLFLGCGVNGIVENTETVSEPDSDISTTEMPSETESATTEIQDTQISDTQNPVEPIEPATPMFQITLPEGAALMGEVFGDGHEPFIPWNHCEMGNYERISQGYIGEALFDVYSALDIYNQNIPEDKQIAECWVLVFEDPKGMQETGVHSNWIY